MDGSGTPWGKLTSVEVCAGAGGQALGLERAGFDHELLVEIEAPARATLKLNRPQWRVPDGEGANLRQFDAAPFRGVDLLAGGLPCPPFSVAGKQLGADDERNLFPDFLRLVEECAPRAILVENVRGFLDGAFEDFRENFAKSLKKMGYTVGWRLLNASDFGVSQLRPRVAIVGFQNRFSDGFNWPEPSADTPPSVGALLGEMMGAGGWEGAGAWAKGADKIAPTIVGGSHKHGGPDLGPTRARRAWAALGVEGKSLADAPPEPGFEGLPRLTVPMVARLQGFPADWRFHGKKTPAYRQVGNAFPPPVAEAVGRQIARALAFSTAPAE
ncbi:MAG: DNA cytosine methyltransferase [Silicimonas sp.]|nr:DNA cytosine methyltransferase [Silicimonas sp.]